MARSPSREEVPKFVEMFESATLPHILSKDDYKDQEPVLRRNLLTSQFALVESRRFPVIVVMAGVDGAGKSEVVHQLYAWLDPHHLETSAFASPTEEERLKPRMWRYWKALPPKGKIGFIFGSWYHQPLRDRVLDKITQSEFERELQAINRFETMLAAEGALILKFWLHLIRDAQGNWLTSPGKSSLTGQSVYAEWSGLGRNDADRSMPAAETMSSITSTGHAPWIVIPSSDWRYRDISVGQTLLNALQKRIECPSPQIEAAAPAILSPVDKRNVLDRLDLTQQLTEKKYDQLLKEYQEKLTDLTESKKFQNISVIALFEGNDAAGKGGVIRRISQSIDPRQFQALAVAAPNDEERAQPYLWRFWKKLPRRGHFATFDRSWYGRVLVERVEALCSEAEWLRAYNEINDFELQLTDSGIVLMKFWLSISSDEQLRRFHEREQNEFKSFKITPEDWRNRKKWNEYAIATGDMIDRTSTRHAHWTLVEANDKLFARIKVLKTICDRIKSALK